MIQARNLSLSFGTQKIFDNLSFTIQHDQRIGLVGLNGSGKSTLLKALGGQQALDEGTVSIERGRTLAYLPQEVVLNSDKSIFDETFSVFTAITLIEQELADLDAVIATQSNADAVHRYAELHEKLKDLEPDKARAQTQRVLQGLGFKQEQLSAPVTSLSVGWKMRIVLAKLLLQNADFYLFDEPTNHLDIVAQQWFLDFLEESSFGFMIVCHERFFLNKLCTKILEMERGKGTFYNGNYDDYESKKAADLEQLHAAYEQQQREIKQKEATINRFRASASKAKMAQSMIKQLDKIERLELPPAPKNISLTFPLTQKPGKVILTVKNVGYRFGDKVIFEHANFEIERGEKVALIAPNGVGKTTLFNVIAGKYPLQTGSIIWGHNTHHALFDQDQTQSLVPNDTVIEAVEKACGNHLQNKIRAFLGAFLFSNDDVNKKTKVLSGGEKNRVGMIRVLLKGANVLLLDEPTNHLDIPSKDILLKALQGYEGTVIFVSHDQDFVNKLATRILELSKDGIDSYQGNYEEFVYQKQHAQELIGKKSAEAESDNSPEHKSNKELFERQKECRRIEQKIQRSEQDIMKMNEQFADFEYGTPEFSQLQTKLTAAQKQLAELYKEWEKLQPQ